MAGHPLNSPRGLHAKKNYRVTASGGVMFDDYSTSTDLLSADANGLVVAGKVKVSNAQAIGANSTAFVFAAAAAKPSTRSAAKWGFITNSTGENGILINTTGATWKFANVTSVLPT